MTMRRIPLVEGEIYHVFNRTVAKQRIFSDDKSISRALEVVSFYRYPQRLRFSKFKALDNRQKELYLHSNNTKNELLNIIAYALMPNHYHFILYQKGDKGITTFISNFQNSFAKYFNILNSRTGSLFQDRFKARRITTQQELIHVIRYVHLNPVTDGLITFENLKSSFLTSHSIYLNQFSLPFIDNQTLYKYFSSSKSYEEFLRDNIDYQKKLARIKRLLFE